MLSAAAQCRTRSRYCWWTDASSRHSFGPIPCCCMKHWAMALAELICKLQPLDSWGDNCIAELCGRPFKTLMLQALRDWDTGSPVGHVPAKFARLSVGLHKQGRSVEIYLAARHREDARPLAGSPTAWPSTTPGRCAAVAIRRRIPAPFPSAVYTPVSEQPRAIPFVILRPKSS